MSRFKTFLYRLRDLALINLGLLVFAVGSYYVVREARDPNGPPVTVSAGRATGQRHQIAETLAAEARRNGQKVTVRETAGSEDALDRVDNRNLDVALIQGGLGLGGRENVRQVAALHIEPLHLLVKEELFGDASRNLAALKGRVVNLSETGSGTHTLATEVLRFAGLIRPTGEADVRVTTLGYAALTAETDRARLPDAAFMVTSLPSPVARHLVTAHNYRVVPLDFGEAFSLDVLARLGAEPAKGHRVEKSYVYDTVIPAYTYGVEPPVPAQPVRTLGTRLLVVAHKSTDARSIEKLLDTVLNTPFVQVSRPPLSPKLLDLPPEFELHAGAVAYQERRKPLITADVIDYSEKVVAIAATLVGGVWFLGKGLTHLAARRRQKRFRRYLLAVAKIEQQALELEQRAKLDLKKLLLLQGWLNDLKNEAINKFASGELQGEQLIAGFLTLVNDTRGYVARLILHQRDNLEERAKEQNKTIDDVWLS